MITSPVTHEHHARLQPHVDDLAVTAGLIGTAPDAELRDRLREASSFLTDHLLSHMEAAERALFPELERLMQNRHSTRPLRREHDEIRALVADLERERATLGGGAVPLRTGMVLRRVLYRLYGLLKIHLAEEQLYADIVEHGLSPEAEAAFAAAMEHQGQTAG